MIRVLRHSARVNKYLNISLTRHFASVTKCDALVLGGGIGGASLSYRLAKLHNLNVVCLEKEESPGSHATGKAFGIFAESNARCVQSKLMTAASRSFFESPDPECIDNYIRENFEQGVLQKTGLLAISSADCYSYLYEQFGPTENLKFNQNIQVYPKQDVINMAPFLNPDEMAPYAIYEPHAANFNTGLVYEHFLVGSHNVGVQYYFNQSAVEMSKNNAGNWEVSSYNAERNSIDRFEAGILINSTGQWVDETAAKAGMKPLDLMTIARNVIVFTYTKGDNNENETSSYKSPFNRKEQDNNNNNTMDNEPQTPWLGWISQNAGEVFHSCFQGGNGIFLYDQIVNKDLPDPDHAGKDEMEIVLHKIAKYTTLKVQKVASKAAGIRCYTKHDRNIVIGPAEEDNSFIYCAALGSFGLQLAPAYSEIGSYLAVGKTLPQSYIDLGIDVNALLPARLYKDEKSSQNVGY
eukprot:532506_1